LFKTPLFRLSSGLAVIMLLGSCTTVNLPSITDSPTNIRLSGKIVWHDLISDTPEASAAFYSELFGWEFESVGGAFGLGSNSAYSLIRHNGRLIGGMVDQNKLQSSEDISQWMSLMSVDDMVVAIARVQAQGGTLLTPPTELADRGVLAVISDPQGAYIALVETRGGDPYDRVPQNGDFLWNELWSTNVEKASRFYRKVGSYDKEIKVIDDDVTYHLLSDKGTPRVGLLTHPAPDIGDVWVNYIRVADPQAILDRVEELGGEILVPLRQRDVGGQVALISGPSGAGIAIQTWDESMQSAIREQLQ